MFLIEGWFSRVSRLCMCNARKHVITCVFLERVLRNIRAPPCNYAMTTIREILGLLRRKSVAVLELNDVTDSLREIPDTEVLDYL